MSGIERDNEGTVWNEKDHNPNKEKKADGTWKLRPGRSRESDLRSKEIRQTETRRPAGMPRMNQTVSFLPDGYRPYWASPKMFEELLNAGYHFVNKDHALVGSDATEGNGLGSVISKIANPSNGERHYLLAIKEEWYLENQKIKHKPIEDFENSINDAKEGFYIPDKNSISMKEMTDG